jgi:hypothetical protein
LVESRHLNIKADVVPANMRKGSKCSTPAMSRPISQIARSSAILPRGNGEADRVRVADKYLSIEPYGAGPACPSEILT